MREFSWKYFTLTGDIEAYLLYRAAQGDDASPADDPDGASAQSAMDAGLE